MRTCVIDRMKRTANIENRNLLAVDLDHRGLARRNIVRAGYSYELGHCISDRLRLIARTLSIAQSVHNPLRLFPRFPSEFSQKPIYRIVKIIDYAFLQRNNRVVGDVNIFGTDFGAAFRDIAKSYA